ncbi:hypothetical protein HELRODRAFT_165900 [Helobdella robusta]|uniref:G-protein coupled receptors family 1 profile domain-containing protein n=1 Tax=Helobdella robusta TaxID=6412 RepID=T1EXF2_HELRO|nr:hypothetical protein HELRODRAFT_165900 [Helobdella robusta]ESN91819.1 hypothetical protein HELRODRAFT_165900 [Helobdella robusta]
MSDECTEYLSYITSLLDFSGFQPNDDGEDRVETTTMTSLDGVDSAAGLLRGQSFLNGLLNRSHVDFEIKNFYKINNSFTVYQEQQQQRQQQQSQLFRYQHQQMLHHQRQVHLVKTITNSIFVPVIAMFGILGNLLNLLVLTRKNVSRISSIERSYNTGLVALAAADLVVCLLYSIRAIVTMEKVWGPQESHFPAYISAYAEPLINVAIFSSTWITTAVALSRYVAICWPLHVRLFVRLRCVRACVVVIVLLAFCVNVPKFLSYQVITMPCRSLMGSGEQVNASGENKLWHENDDEERMKNYLDEMLGRGGEEVNRTASSIDLFLIESPSDKIDGSRSSQEGSRWRRLNLNEQHSFIYDNYDYLDNENVSKYNAYGDNFNTNKKFINNENIATKDYHFKSNSLQRKRIIYNNSFRNNDDIKVKNFNRVTNEPQLRVFPKHITEKCECYFARKQPMEHILNEHGSKQAYSIFTITTTTLIPLAIMIFCNVCFIKALRQSFAMQRAIRNTQMESTNYYSARERTPTSKSAFRASVRSLHENLRGRNNSCNKKLIFSGRNVFASDDKFERDTMSVRADVTELKQVKNKNSDVSQDDDDDAFDGRDKKMVVGKRDRGNVERNKNDENCRNEVNSVDKNECTSDGRGMMFCAPISDNKNLFKKNNKDNSNINKYPFDQQSKCDDFEMIDLKDTPTQTKDSSHNDHFTKNQKKFQQRQNSDEQKQSLQTYLSLKTIQKCQPAQQQQLQQQQHDNSNNNMRRHYSRIEPSPISKVPQENKITGQCMKTLTTPTKKTSTSTKTTSTWKQSTDDNYITPTLITLIISLILLVLPSDILNFVQIRKISSCKAVL